MNGGRVLTDLPAFDFKGVKLYIGIPSRGTCSTDFAKSLALTCAILDRLGVDFCIHESRNSCFVDMSRNKLVAEFLKTDFTHIWMVDDDMGWNADAVPKMLAKDLEFIAAAGPKKTDAQDEFCCNINVLPDETPIVKDGLLSASKVGGAFVILKREALLRLIDKFPELKCLPVDSEFGYRLFECTYTVNKWITEDYNFCERFLEAGGEIWIYPDVDFIHTGMKDFKGNYHKFLMGKPKDEAKAESKNTKFSIVIVAYKGEEALSRCLSSLIDHAPESAELVIVDNSPKPIEFAPALIDILDKKYREVIIHQDGKNKGFAAGCNLGARLSSGENLVFVNPDTVVYPNWAEMMAAHLREGVGAVGPLSNFVAGYQNWVLYTHSAPMAKENVDHVTCRFAAKVISSAKIHASIKTKLLIGFFLMVPREVWNKVGEMDPEFVLGCDDLDYSMRLTDAGYKLVIAPDVFVYHEGHVSFREEGDPALEMNKRSEAVLRAKLKAKYGDNIPSSTEIWGCDIFATDPLLSEVLA